VCRRTCRRRPLGVCRWLQGGGGSELAELLIPLSSTLMDLTRSSDEELPGEHTDQSWVSSRGSSELSACFRFIMHISQNVKDAPVDSELDCEEVAWLF
jgi:hypothetical protein